METNNLSAKDRIVKAKVKMYKTNPFFAYLVMNLNFIEQKEVGTIGVDFKGNCYYAPSFVESLSQEELHGVLAHETLHLVFEHRARLNGRIHALFNVAGDMVINDVLISEGFILPRTVKGQTDLIPLPYDHRAKFEGIEVCDLNKKTAVQVYEELYKALDKQGKIHKVKEISFDKHFTKDESKEDGQEPTNEQLREQGDKWKKTLSEAGSYARQMGQMSSGLSLLVDGLLNEKVNWKQLLYKYITRILPYDYTYARPSKKSVSSGFYMPSVLKESIEIVVSIDTSGSISKEELTEFLTEITAIAKSFNNLNMKLIVCDSEIKEVYHIGNGDADKIAQLKIRGGGGTSHKPIYDYISQNLPNTKLVVNFTDGYTDFPEEEKYKTLWVLVGDIEEKRIPFGEIIRI